MEAYRKEGLLYHCQREVVDPEGGHSCLARPLLVPVGWLPVCCCHPLVTALLPGSRCFQRSSFRGTAEGAVGWPSQLHAQHIQGHPSGANMTYLLATGNQRDSPDVHCPDRPAARRPHPDCKDQVGASPASHSSGSLCPSEVHPGAARAGCCPVLGWASWSHAVLSSVRGCLKGGKETGALKARLQSLAFTCR